jgi:hypothetical protein
MNECAFNDYTYASPHNVTDSCNDAISQANSIIGDYINNYDVILDVCYPSIVNQELRLRKMVCSLYSLLSSSLFIPHCKFIFVIELSHFAFPIYLGYQDKCWCWCVYDLWKTFLFQSSRGSEGSSCKSDQTTLSLVHVQWVSDSCFLFPTNWGNNVRILQGLSFHDVKFLKTSCMKSPLEVGFRCFSFNVNFWWP